MYVFMYEYLFMYISVLLLFARIVYISFYFYLSKYLVLSVPSKCELADNATGIKSAFVHYCACRIHLYIKIIVNTFFLQHNNKPQHSLIFEGKEGKCVLRNHLPINLYSIYQYTSFCCLPQIPLDSFVCR